MFEGMGRNFGEMGQSSGGGAGQAEEVARRGVGLAEPEGLVVYEQDRRGDVVDAHA